MPTDLLPLRVEHFLLRACPSAVLATHDIVAEAVRRNLRDEDVISQLVKEYNCDRMGFPMGAMPTAPSLQQSPMISDPDAATSKRRRMVINYYIVNKIFPIDLKKIDVLCSDKSVNDGIILAGLKGKYGLTELGEPCPKVPSEANVGEKSEVENSPNSDGNAQPAADVKVDDPLGHVATSSPVHPYPPTLASAKILGHQSEAMSLRHEVGMLFLRAAPERFAEAKGVCDSFERLEGAATKADVLTSVRRSLGGCASDGWPLDPDKRRLARLQPFFLNNDSSRLYERPEEITELVNSRASEHVLFLELYYAYGKDELGRALEMDQYLHDEVSLLLSRCRPVAATEEFTCTYLALGQRKGWDAEQLLQYLRGLFDCDRDGWPLEIRQRIRSRTLRYLMQNAPEDVANIDAVLNELIGGSSAGSPASMGGWHGEGLNEALILTRLYERYGRNEDGKPVLNTPAIRFRVCEFLEQYVPESEVERLADAALGLNMFPDTLMHHLKQQYSTFTPYPNELRLRLKAIYRRAAPDKLYQIDQLLRVKRVEKIPDATIIKAVCKKLNCGPDGWPVDPLQRKRKRLQQFFETYDPPRLVQVEVIMERQYNIHTGQQDMAKATELFSPEHSYVGPTSPLTTEAQPSYSRLQGMAPSPLRVTSPKALWHQNNSFNNSDAGMAMSPISGLPPNLFASSGTTYSVTAPSNGALLGATSLESMTMDGSPRKKASGHLGFGNKPIRSAEADTFDANRHKYRWMSAPQ